ncbi:MAG: hypothetical protein PSX80_16125 [bacterium]|nr:hypothetical protein [bacterium]
MRVLITFAALLIFAGSATADVPRPKVTPNKPTKATSIDTRLDIRLRRDAKEARLILSRSQLNQLRAELDAIESGTPDTASAGIAGIQTIAGGLFLSLAMVFAGVWFVRSGRMSKPVAATVIAVAVGTLATMVYANAGPPPEARSITGKMFAQGMHYYKFGGGAIKLEVSADEDNPVLIVPDPEEPKKPGEE